jgi:hypothetical protein
MATVAPAAKMARPAGIVARAAGRADAASSPLHLQIEHGVGSLGDVSQAIGTVQDASGAMIPGASVKLNLLPNGPTHETKTDGAGHFALPSLPAGRYLVSISSPGFQTITQQVEFAPRDTVTMASVLPVGSVAQTVAVSNADVMVPVESQSVSSLPMMSRNVRLSECDGPLPSKLPLTTCTTVADRMLALDSAGSLFVRRGNKKWKRVKSSWQGKVTANTTASCPASQPGTAATCTPMFEIKTDTGTTWISADGEHWKQQ